MGLIKSANVPDTVAAFSMRDVENAAKAMLLRARAQAEQLLAEAQVQAEALQTEAYADAHKQGLADGQREGFEKGMKDGLAAGTKQALDEHKADFTATVNALGAAAAQIDALRRDLESQGLDEIVTLAIAIAKRVTKRMGAVDPAVLTGNLAEAMKLVSHAHDVRIAINPAQRAVMDATMPQLKLTWPQLKHVELIEDESIAPGGCRLLTARGSIDADLDQQLDRVIGDLLPDSGEAAAS